MSVTCFFSRSLQHEKVGSDINLDENKSLTDQS